MDRPSLNSWGERSVSFVRDGKTLSQCPVSPPLSSARCSKGGSFCKLLLLLLLLLFSTY